LLPHGRAIDCFIGKRLEQAIGRTDRFKSIDGCVNTRKFFCRPTSTGFAFDPSLFDWALGKFFSIGFRDNPCELGSGFLLGSTCSLRTGKRI
jgi:hypothetical protein